MKNFTHTHTEYTSNEWTTWIIWWWSIEYVKDLMAKTSKYLMANVCVRSLWFTHIQWWKTWWIWSFLSFLVWSLYTVIRSMFTIVVVVVVMSCQLVCLRFYFYSYLFGLGLTKLKKIFFCCCCLFCTLFLLLDIVFGSCGDLWWWWLF